ncbi:MAG: hypothetical protein KJO56_01970 [Gammaproteobacteria bacterium]|nr:hypothetical protein [Gammaproteobacteria bacterium]
MRHARSAKACYALGATLIVFASPALAEDSGSSVVGIDGGASAGIDGGATAGIDGGAILGIDGGATAGIDGGAILAGPVDAIDLGNGVFHSLGQAVLTSHEVLSQMRVGDFVEVSGSVVSAGWLYADEVAISNIDYVPGATEVFVSGMLSGVDFAAGTARLGGLTIDYTPSLALGAAPSSAMWSFQGTRPASEGLMISRTSHAIAQ